jgi:GTPase SAR1 family protein
MPTANGDGLSWPALDAGQGAGQPLPGALTYERGIWGKVHGAPSDFRWIATTPGFAAAHSGLERELPLGGEDAPASGMLWRTIGDTCYAAAFYPSPAQDAAGRSGFLEKQVLEWKRPPEVPAALGALLLLDTVARLGPDIYWNRRSDIRWSEDDYTLDLGADAHPLLPVSAAALEDAIARGIEILRAAVSEEGVAELYAALLAGGRSVPLRGLAAPLPPAALAALLLPLPRTLADQLSVAGWLPSSRLSDTDLQEVRRCWDLVLGGATTLPPTGPVPTPDQLREARSMARELFGRTPARPSTGTAASAADPNPAAGRRPVQLTLWGPSSAGKTVLLAKLYLETENREDWDIFPTQKSVDFIQTMRERMRTSNLFPPATTVGHVEGIEYLFRHRQTGLEASLQLEDRAGRESEDLQDESDTAGGKVSLKQRLGSAQGLVLLFDPISDETLLESRVWRTLELLHVASGRGVQKDERPIAVCLSKADVLIETAADFRRALETPDEFVRERVPAVLLHALDRFCTHYRLFPVSAAGVRLRHGVVEPVVFLDEDLKPRVCPGGQAFNLMAPFAWLLQELTGLS